jgi:hypothetical protein
VTIRISGGIWATEMSVGDMMQIAGAADVEQKSSSTEYLSRQ